MTNNILLNMNSSWLKRNKQYCSPLDPCDLEFDASSQTHWCDGDNVWLLRQKSIICVTARNGCWFGPFVGSNRRGNDGDWKWCHWVCHDKFVPPTRDQSLACIQRNMKASSPLQGSFTIATSNSFESTGYIGISAWFMSIWLVVYVKTVRNRLTNCKVMNPLDISRALPKMNHPRKVQNDYIW